MNSVSYYYMKNLEYIGYDGDYEVDKSSKVNFTNQVMLETKSRLKETQYNKITVKLWRGTRWNEGKDR